MTIRQLEREYTDLYSETIDSLEQAYEAQEIDEDEFLSLKTQTLAELEEALAELRGLTQEDLETYNENDNQEYSMNNNYANFSTASAYLVPAVMELIDTHYEDRDEAFSDIMDATGIDEDDLEGFLTGQLEATPEFIDILNGMFEETATDVEAALGLQMMGALDRGDTSEEELEEAEYETYEEDEEDDDNTEEESEVDAEAVYSYIDPRVQELESKMADFELSNELKVRLANISDYARQGIEERWLSKAQYDLLIGSFNRDEDRVAAFSQTAEANNVDLSTQLYAVLFALKAAEKCGDPRINFSSYVQEADFSAKSEEDELARFQIEKMIENKRIFSKVRR
jgi:uncharacterized protein YciW